MPSPRLRRSWLAVLPLAGLVALPLTTSSAQTPAYAPAYGGGSLPTSLPKSTVQTFEKATAIALVPSGDSVRIRISLGIRCTGYKAKISSDDALLRVPLATDGTFSGKRKVRSGEMGDLTVAVSGTITAEVASGELTASSIRSPQQRCARSKRSWVAKPVDVKASFPTEGNVAGGALLVGLSSQKSSIPFGVVARMSANGKRVNSLFNTAIMRCRAEGRRARKSRYTYDVQHVRSDVPVRDRKLDRRGSYRERAAERRRGIRYSGTRTFTGRVSAAGMRAIASEVNRYREPGYAERCVIPRTVLRLVPAT